MVLSPSLPAGLPAALRARVHLVGSVGATGAGVGAAATLLLRFTAVVDTNLVFAFGALLLGFGVLGWSGSLMVGEGVENAKRHLDLDTDWTERASRRAMARIAGFGVGVMVGSAVLLTVWAGG